METSLRGVLLALTARSKAALDDVAKNLQQNADSKLVIVGNAEPTEKRKNLAAERAVNSKAYLTGGESKLGIDPSRIEVRTGSGWHEDGGILDRTSGRFILRRRYPTGG